MSKTGFSWFSALEDGALTELQIETLQAAVDSGQAESLAAAARLLGLDDRLGTIAPGRDAYDVVRACFPAGTVSGAPKIRAMQIIDELEPTRRGPYAGAVGYFGFSGSMDTCITIRTLVIKDKTAYIQAGGGVVADSVPALEYQETVNKAKAMMRAVEMAEEGLD